ncbi:MAG: hypothetical protein A2W25_15305 [candidate division Zixibacteria bacterium RBG_16_53_22]|nr:MAG: hypothetical protein A2W25_15305 [candidate division Zixibacteria bacterium RBG_16_53_22]
MTHQERVKSFAHQKEARKLSKGRAAFGYLMEQGTGKSKTLVDDAAYHFSIGEIELLVVTAPNGVQRGWFYQHLPDHMPVGILYKAMVFSAEKTKKRERLVEDMLNNPFKGLRVFLLNYESLIDKKRGAGFLLLELLKKYKTLWALDESHRIKNWDAKTTRTIIDLSTHASVRRIMTGTFGFSPEDLYPQMAFLDKHILGYPSYTAYRCHFAVMEPDNSNTMRMIKRRLVQKYGEVRARSMMPKVVARDAAGRKMYKNLDELQQLIAPHTYRKLKVDCLDLPSKVYQKRYVELTSEQRTIYNTLRDSYMAEYEGKFLDASMALTRLTRLQQVAGGFFPSDDEGGKVFPIGEVNPKLQEVLEIIEDTGEGKVIIWARFVAELHLIANILRETYGPGTVARYWGDIKTKERDLGKDEFCAAGSKRRFFVSQQRSGGTGLDGLQIARMEIYVSNDHSLLNRLQSEDRCDRIGALGSLTIVDIEATDTRDGFIIDALRGKKDVADIINGDPSKAWI